MNIDAFVLVFLSFFWRPPQHQILGQLKSPVNVICLHLTFASGKISGFIDNELQGELQTCHMYTRMIDGTAQQKIHSSNQLHLRPSAEFCYSPTLAEANDKTVRKCRMITTLEQLCFHSDLSGSCSHFNSGCTKILATKHFLGGKWPKRVFLVFWPKQFYHYNRAETGCCDGQTAANTPPQIVFF